MKKLLIQVDEQEIRVTGGRLRMARLEAEFYHHLSDPAAIISSLRGLRERPDVFTFTQPLTDTQPRYAYRMEWDNLAVIPIISFEYWWEKQLVGGARNKARQAAKKGVVLREVPFSDDLVRGIWKIYNETPIRQGRPFPHFGKDQETVYREEATFLDDSIFIGAYFEDELVGFVKLVMDPARTQAGMMNILAMIRHRDKAPNNALISQSVRSCADRGLSNLFYWRFAHGKRERDSVSDFKVRNGFQRVDLPRYYVPLTAWGDVALRLGLHHRFVDRIPNSLSSKLRELRGRWYNRTQAVESQNAQAAS